MLRKVKNRIWGHLEARGPSHLRSYLWVGLTSLARISTTRQVFEDVHIHSFYGDFTEEAEACCDQTRDLARACSLCCVVPEPVDAADLTYIPQSTMTSTFHTHEYVKNAFQHQDFENTAKKKGSLATKSLSPAPSAWVPLSKSLDVTGQGSMGFKLNAQGPIRFKFDPEEGTGSTSLVFEVNEKGMCIKDKTNTEPLAFTEKQKVDVGRMQTYWISINKNLNQIKCGTGYMINALTQLECNGMDHKMIAALKTVSSQGVSLYQKTPMEVIFWKWPVTVDIPPFILPNNEVSLLNLDEDNKTVVQNLSEECQDLYANVSGDNIQLNTPDFPDFSEAIDHSIRTEGAVCNMMLASKVSEFSEGATKNDANETYLRITLGKNKGDSPGVPFVMEIWPGGHYSPIHNHSNACAVIKVLYGSLTTFWYKSLEQEDDTPYARGVCSTGDVTWLSDRQFQTHRLFNHSVGGPPCVTVQCYKYNSDDNLHYEYFDYLNEDGTKGVFTPNSDWDYAEFKKLLQDEYAKFKANAEPEPNWVNSPTKAS